MSKARFQKIFGETEKAALLKAIGECRIACLKGSHAALGNDKVVVKNCEALISAIDDLAETLTGRREHFWAKPISSRDFEA